MNKFITIQIRTITIQIRTILDGKLQRQIHQTTINFRNKYVFESCNIERNWQLYLEEKISKYQNSNINTPDIFYQLDTFSIFEVPII